MKHLDESALAVSLISSTCCCFIPWFWSKHRPTVSRLGDNALRELRHLLHPLKNVHTVDSSAAVHFGCPPPPSYLRDYSLRPKCCEFSTFFPHFHNAPEKWDESWLGRPGAASGFKGFIPGSLCLLADGCFKLCGNVRMSDLELLFFYTGGSRGHTCQSCGLIAIRRESEITMHDCRPFSKLLVCDSYMRDFHKGFGMSQLKSGIPFSAVQVNVIT